MSNIDFIYKSFNKDYFEFTEIEKLNASWIKPHPHTYIYNNDYSAKSVHDADNKSESEFKKMIPQINEKYKRRFNRLYNELNIPGNNILLIRDTQTVKIGNVPIKYDTENKINKLIKLLKQKFIANIKLVVIDKNLFFDSKKLDNDVFLFYSYKSFEKFLKLKNIFI